jgi:hypothetical protein
MENAERASLYAREIKPYLRHLKILTEGTRHFACFHTFAMNIEE